MHVSCPNPVTRRGEFGLTSPGYSGPIILSWSATLEEGSVYSPICETLPLASMWPAACWEPPLQPHLGH